MEMGNEARLFTVLPHERSQKH